MDTDFLKEAQKYFAKFAPRHSIRTELWETLRFILIALAVVLPIRLFVAQPFIVSGASMNPTFVNGQYLIVDELSYHLNNPMRGDVAVFKYPKNPKQYFIKRVIGLPGETVVIDGQGIVDIKNSFGEHLLTLDEPYIQFPKHETLEYTLAEGEYFMMGDNRAGSYDSRMWGPVQRDFIIGKAFIRLFPFTTIDLHPGATSYTSYES